MRKVGKGWQYTVYDLGNGRVLKKLNNKFDAYCMMLKGCFPYLRVWKFQNYYQSSINMATNSIRNLKKLAIDQEVLGNPNFFENSLDYEQDKIIPVDTYLKNISLNKGRKLIDDFLDFNRFLIQNGFIDKSFALGKNFGVNLKGKIILSDLGELHFSPELIQKQISNRAWTADYVTKALPKNLRKYFLEKMESLV
jgi:hypothetical protein